MEKRSAGKKRWLVLLVLAAVLLLPAAALRGLHLWETPAPAGAPKIEVTIPRGAGLNTAARALARAGILQHPRLFALAGRLLGGDTPIQYGTYLFPKGEGMGRILQSLQQGDVLFLRITIPEGMPSILVAERLNATPRLTGHVTPPPEGSVLPATYEAHVGDSRAALLKRMQEDMRKVSEELWKKRSPETAVKTLKDAIILASIVEKESGKASERRRIAGLYGNRLSAGMRLQADPTVIYPITRGRPLGRRILQSELSAENGYNTYTMAGLPVGPITNPGRASLEAVLHPEPNHYLYMVASGDGGHVFAESYAAHQANVAKWRRFRAERGV